MQNNWRLLVLWNCALVYICKVNLFLGAGKNILLEAMDLFQYKDICLFYFDRIKILAHETEFEVIVIVCILMPCFACLISVFFFLLNSGAVRYYVAFVCFIDVQTEEEYTWIKPVLFFSFILTKQDLSGQQEGHYWRALCIQHWTVQLIGCRIIENSDQIQPSGKRDGNVNFCKTVFRYTRLRSLL